jgi:hypothetical protein
LRILSTKRLLPLAVLLGFLGAGAPASAQVVIHEIMYHPVSDLDGDEFLEIRNLSASSVDLTGWCVEGVDFCFPPGASIGGSAYAVIAKDAARFQTTYGFAPDFVFDGKLDNSGEELKLVDGAAQVVDQVTYSDMPPWPVKADGLGPSLEVVDATQDNSTPRNWRASTAVAGHTAKAANSVQASGLPPWIDATTRTPDPGQVSTPTDVTATVLDATSVTLFYKIGFATTETALTMLDDGAHADGAPGDGVYGATIPGQFQNTIIRYRIHVAGATGLMDYPRTDDTITYVGTYIPIPQTTSLPVLEWLMDNVDYNHAIQHKFTDQTEPCMLFYAGKLYDGVRTRVRGQTSRSFAKPNWKFILPHNHDLDTGGLLDEPVDNFDLQAGWSDKSHLREYLAWGTMRDVGNPFSHVFHHRVHRNGAFQGLYAFVEDPDGNWLERNGLDTDGARYKSFDDMRDRGSVANITSRYEKQTRTYEDYSDLYAVIHNINTLTGTALKTYLFDNIDLPRTINYLAAGVVMHNNDQVAKNFYIYRDTMGTQRWSLQPWDLDLTFGRNYNGTVLNDEIWANKDTVVGVPAASPSHPLFGDFTHQKIDLQWNRLYDKLYLDPDIKAMFFRRLRTVMDEQLVAGHFESIIDAIVPTIAPEVDLDIATWGQYGTAETFSQSVDRLKNEYLAVRRTHLFTTHRVPGEIPEAQSAAPRVVISEIMYNPAGGSDYEFLELYNPSATESVDISSWHVDGLAFTIPRGTVILPSAYALLVKNDVQFRTNYGGGKFVAAQYSGSLANEGETLTLRDRNGIAVASVSYSPDTPWPSGANGGGFSLELVDAAQANAWVANWAQSNVAGGTPGAANSAAGTKPPFPGLFLNEILSVNTTLNTDEAGDHDPWVEIYNASPLSADLGGMFLGSSFSTPQEFTFPVGTTLCSGCWMLVWADGEPLEGPLHTPFRLSGSGGTLVLSTPSGLIADYLSYGALGANTSFGRFRDGAQDTRVFVHVTPSAANDATPVAALLNEYNAVDPGVFLKNGASDPFWGRVAGNGGDWYEIVVTQDHLDLRDWQLLMTDDTGGPDEFSQSIVLTQDPIWSDVRSGTILTISEDLPDDVSYDPAGGDWWINVQANFSGTGTYITNQSFTVSNDSWQLRIRDALGNVVFGPAGEGVNPTSGVGSDEVFKLEAHPTPFTTPLSNYKDGTSSTFGGPNVWSSGTLTQDFDLLRCTGFECATLDDACSLGACDGAIGQCVARANGSCPVTGVVRYYRDLATAAEPSTKPVPNTPIESTQDLVPDATTTSAGLYDVGAMSGNVQVRTLGHFGAIRAADHNDAITSFDASLIAQHAVEILTLSPNQQIAADVSGNGGVTAFDASLVAQFAVALVDHFDVATSTGSDWKYLRCDDYASATSQDCGVALYTHAPLAGAVEDDFYAILYGDVTGNWEPAASEAARAASASTPEGRAAAADLERAKALSGARSRPVAPSGTSSALPAALSVSPGIGPFRAGVPATIRVDLSRADGILALDLAAVYDPSEVTIGEMRAVGIAAGMSLESRDAGGRHRSALYGAQPLAGSGQILELTVTPTRDLLTLPITFTGTANEGRIRLISPRHPTKGIPSHVDSPHR